MREWPAGEDDWLISLWSLNEEDDGEMEQGADAADAARSRGRSRRPHVSRLDFLAQSRSSRLRRPHVPHDQGASLSLRLLPPLGLMWRSVWVSGLPSGRLGRLAFELGGRYSTHY
jgi:hypothetical protein